tara:strand:+ start:895 stop:1701 length:807 start_codon:yes stop_codon:yes gene_type:complete
MKTIISLTTIHSRINILRYTIFSLLNQSLKPDEIHINISKNGFLLDKGFKNIPDWLDELKDQKKLNINWVENNGPYRKLFPIIHTLNKNDIVVICDDDVIYSENWFHSLLLKSKIENEAVICGNARMIKRFSKKIYKSYVHWPIFKGKASKNKIIPVGVGGVLYKPKFFDFKKLTNIEYKNIASMCDDLWFWSSLKEEIQIIALDEDEILFHTINSPTSLTNLNYSISRNVKNKIKSKFLFLLGHFGFSVINNDVVFKKINKFFKLLE